ncbi:hypothetical protein [Gulosibacter chungangensis]|uniref:hypothetical protein n=1 Tax=Gulosibacter chungangensis TaxID=979746 RepID=UPI001CE45BC6|nr:hypothetical protein [Gulosibacter chungangensis]
MRGPMRHVVLEEAKPDMNWLSWRDPNSIEFQGCWAAENSTRTNCADSQSVRPITAVPPIPEAGEGATLR